MTSRVWSSLGADGTGASASAQACCAVGGRQVRGSPHGLACHVSAQGPFDMDDCVSKHSINPYGNRESRVLFSTWNLDHV